MVLRFFRSTYITKIADNELFAKATGLKNRFMHWRVPSRRLNVLMSERRDVITWRHYTMTLRELYKSVKFLSRYRHIRVTDGGAEKIKRKRRVGENKKKERGGPGAAVRQTRGCARGWIGWHTGEAIIIVSGWRRDSDDILFKKQSGNSPLQEDRYNAASARQPERPTGEKLWRDRENELREKGITKDERGDRTGWGQKDEGRQKVNFEMGWYRDKLYISKLPRALAFAGPSGGER